MTISMVSHATLKALLLGLLLLVTVRADQAGSKKRQLGSNSSQKMKKGGEVYERESYREEMGGGGKYAEDYMKHMKKGKKCGKGKGGKGKGKKGGKGGTKAPSSDGKGSSTKSPSASSTKSPSAYSSKSTKAPFVCEDEDTEDDEDTEAPSLSDAPASSKAPSGSSTTGSSTKEPTDDRRRRQ
jgi:hypothetical protein